MWLYKSGFYIFMVWFCMYVSKCQQNYGVARDVMFNIGVWFIDWDTCDYIKNVFTFLNFVFGRDIMLFCVILHVCEQMSAKLGCYWGCHAQCWSVIPWLGHMWLCTSGFYIFKHHFWLRHRAIWVILHVHVLLGMSCSTLDCYSLIGTHVIV